ncbi:hypothetical protein [Marinicella sp. W31]|uniref:hypothetical protein n=1 Tax=Marinicella sp. W31 TaxID=3023713 RepID=UPI003756D557
MTTIAILIGMVILLFVITVGISALESEFFNVLASALMFAGIFSVLLYSDGTNHDKQSLIQSASMEILYDGKRSCKINNYELKEYVDKGIQQCFTKSHYDLIDSIIQIQKNRYIDPITGSVDTILNSPVAKRISSDMCIGAIQITLETCPHLFNKFSESEILKLESY